ncbi:hypothetical protein QTP88_003940 [Uroleucon formosanum]
MSKKFVFSSTEDEILIEYVQQNREIFDSAHLTHKNIHFKEKIWKIISEKVGRTENDNSLSTAEDGDNTQNHTLIDEDTFESPNTWSDLPSISSISTTVKKLPPRAINEAKLQILTLISHLEDKYSNFQPQVGSQPQLYQPQYFDYQFLSQQSHVAQPSPSPSISSSSHGFELYKTHNHKDDN